MVHGIADTDDGQVKGAGFLNRGPKIKLDLPN